MQVARPGRSPIIEFGSASFRTKHGTRMGPKLKVTGWCGGRSDDEAKQLPPAASDFDDTIPF
jgi:hypothetical protein